MNEDVQRHKYLSLFTAIRNDIILKVYPPESLLPTENHLMEQYGVGRNTVRRAMKMLQDEGYIATRRGSGSLVVFQGESSSPRPPKLHDRFGKVGIEFHVPVQFVNASHAAVDKVIPPADVAQAFGISPTTEVCRIQRIWNIDGKIPYTYMVQYFNPELVPNYENFDHSSEQHFTYPILEKKWGIRFLRGQEHYSCRSAGFVEAKLLNLQIGDALLLTTRNVFCERGMFEYAVFYGNPNYMGYATELNPDP